MSTFELTNTYPWSAVPVACRIVDASPRRKVVLTGEITATAVVGVGSGPAYRCLLDDGTGQVDLLFLGRRRVPGIHTGSLCRVEGTVAADGDRLVIWNPLYVLEAGASHRPQAEEVAAVRRRAG
jgi:hypothetical protein